MPQTVNVRGLCLGEGRPKICVPVMGTEWYTLEPELAAVLDAGAELVEWRADCLAAALGQAALPELVARTLALLGRLRTALAGVPLLFTLRSTTEGGSCALDDEATARLLCAAAQGGLVDLVDVEARLGRALCERVLHAAGAAGAKMVTSHHDFAKTPPVEEMLDILQRQQALGAHIVKLAVMPHTPLDVLALLQATSQYQAAGGGAAITMAMGPLGAISRVAGEGFGSCVSFGAAQAASAPGQLPAAELRRALDILHGAQSAGLHEI